MTALVLMLGGFFFLPTSASAKHNVLTVNPVIFVHGGSGSGAQFESQAQRFTSNGYPHDLIAVQEYDSTFSINTVNDVYAGLDQLVAALLEQTGADQVDILGHSLGTTLMFGYLTSTPERAAKVAHYVNIDGQTRLPDGVNTLALWAGRGTPGRTMVGATNVTIPDVTHVQCATSAESFVEMYKFFTGEAPATKDIVPEPPGQVRLAGRAVIFPENRGAEDRTLQIWRVDGDTGARIDKKPEAVFAIGADGAWGPFKAKGGRHYEFVLLLAGAFTHHLYYEPFFRSDYLIRLNGGVAVLGLAMSSLAPTPSRADSPIVSEYLQVPSIAQPADTPNALNRVAFLRIYDKDAHGRVSSPSLSAAPASPCSQA